MDEAVDICHGAGALHVILRLQLLLVVSGTQPTQVIDEGLFDLQRVLRLKLFQRLIVGRQALGQLAHLGVASLHGGHRQLQEAGTAHQRRHQSGTITLVAADDEFLVLDECPHQPVVLATDVLQAVEELQAGRPVGHKRVHRLPTAALTRSVEFIGFVEKERGRKRWQGRRLVGCGGSRDHGLGVQQGASQGVGSPHAGVDVDQIGIETNLVQEAADLRSSQETPDRRRTVSLHADLIPVQILDAVREGLPYGILHAAGEIGVGPLGVDVTHEAAQSLPHLCRWHLTGEVAVRRFDGGLEMATRCQGLTISQTLFDTEPQLGTQTRIECRGRRSTDDSHSQLGTAVGSGSEDL